MPEDRRIALAALAVTAIVGIAAPLGAVLLTDANENNRIHAEHAQADRAELREVLDDAATALSVGSYRFRQESYREARAPASHDPVRANRRLQPEVERLERHYNRVAIRLGRDADATRRMNDALAVAYEIVAQQATKSQQSWVSHPGRNIAEFGRAVNEYEKSTGRFIDAANRVAHSTMD